jgi:hypothetical protein
MNRQEHLLLILEEECIETAQRVSKALRFSAEEIQPGQELTNAQRLIYEFNDIVAMMEMLKDEGVIGDFHDPIAVIKKKEKVEKFLELSKECGTLSGMISCPQCSKSNAINGSGDWMTCENCEVSWKFIKD